ncbi:hypothetical protein [Pseudarthrobacter sp. PS3-L1]|uniref:hypothetical protein n=1 Tax=Pseudarthrobacter sp. PS3-L1 TaxID=3046207 RepID=UPI0024B9EF34|nr:hypothetical protein [Pseudarthrobacter sp. PS3-L1]MDJ0321841.1 hypothetical protein [Pseudarthrobacter sp. PS3-L1]
MGLLESLGLRRDVVEAAPVDDGTVASLEFQLERVQERLAALAREDIGWDSLTGQGGAIFTREVLARNADLVRITSIMNPLMKRGKQIRSSYVFGQGVQVAARASEGGQDLNALVTAYLTDEGNEAAVFGAQARQGIEHDLFDDGNEFVAHFVDPLTGRVQARPFAFDEIVEVVTAPGDKFTPWFYKRVWTEVLPTESLGALTRQMTAYYPALTYQPLTKMKTYNGHPVMWPGTVGGAAVYHIKVNPVGRDRIWGVGDGYSALPWSKAYKEFLEAWAVLMQALSRIAGVIKDKNSKAQGMRAAANQIQSGPAGQMVATGTGDVEFPSKSGATLDSESGRPLAAMVAAALGIPVTILLADPGVTGSRATAETLDLPTRLEMMGRQEVHAQFYRASVGYAIEQAVMAPRGPLKGTVLRDGDRLLIALAADQEATVEVNFPDLEEIDIKTLMDAIVMADGTGKVPPLEILKLILHALRIRDIEEILDQVTDDNDQYIEPGVTAGAAAADAFKRGEDPATVV